MICHVLANICFEKLRGPYPHLYLNVGITWSGVGFTRSGTKTTAPSALTACWSGGDRRGCFVSDPPALGTRGTHAMHVSHPRR